MKYCIDLRLSSIYANVYKSSIEKRKYFICACKTDNEDREDLPIARIDIDSLDVEYIDEDAKHDPFAQAIIAMAINDLKI